MVYDIRKAAMDLVSEEFDRRGLEIAIDVPEKTDEFLVAGVFRDLEPAIKRTVTEISIADESLVHFVMRFLGNMVDASALISLDHNIHVSRSFEYTDPQFADKLLDFISEVIHYQLQKELYKTYQIVRELDGQSSRA